MRQEWQESIAIAASPEEVYRYLADFPSHCEWAQTLERLERTRAGDVRGVGARYRAIEHQALQSDRGPQQPISARGGLRSQTSCEIRELLPGRRIAWHAHTLPRSGLRADLSFDLADKAEHGTLLTQRIVFHQPGLLRLIFRLILRATEEELVTKGAAQWSAGLRNIKTILEARKPPANQQTAA